jgi:hypothetical protein
MTAARSLSSLNAHTAQISGVTPRSATVGITLDTYSHVAPALARQAADDLAALILGSPETD